MKAAVYFETGGPEVFRYEEVPDPVCEPGGVLIDVRAVSIEGGDVLNRAGGMLAAKPHIVGYQCAGVAAEVGADVRDRSVGQRVVADSRFPLAEAAEAHRRIESRLAFGRVPLIP